jgi:CBS domain containing-hemolysin-like protein
VDESKIVRDVMHPALTIDINASLREAANMMIQNHHHRLVVIDNNDPDAFPLGAISTFDIVAEMARPDSVWQNILIEHKVLRTAIPFTFPEFKTLSSKQQGEHEHV